MPKYKVTYLIDVVSNNPKHYTRYFYTEAKDEVEAIKKAAMSLSEKSSVNTEWINNMAGNAEEIMNKLRECRYCITKVELYK